MSTSNQHLQHARWTTLYLSPRTNLITVRKPRVINAETHKLCSTLRLLSLETMVVLTNVGITQHKITTLSRKTLEKTKLKHHVYRKTWKQQDLVVFDQE